MQNDLNLSELNSKLPPIISRDHVEKLLGGIISSKRLANLDSLGEGPKRMRIGRKIAYLTEDLLKWIESRTKILN
jgi:predicted DNA-binding transcriptional regulator AlpA